MWEICEPDNFATGTEIDQYGDEEENCSFSPEDTNTWALLAFGDTGTYNSALHWVYSNCALIEPSTWLAVGIDFNNDKDGIWWGLTRRARVIYASKDRVKQDQITYEELADPKWRGKICIRSGQHVYNVALIASMIAAHGEEKTEEWLKGVKANLARKPAGDDRMQVKGVYSGECDLAIGNTYYMGSMLKNEKEPVQKEWANSVNMLFPNTNDRGTHVNISGAVLAKNAPHKDNAVKLIEFLASDEGQEMYADVNNEYPVKEGVPWSPLVQSWGSFKSDPISLNEVAAQRKKASELVDKVGFDDGPSS